MVHFLSPADQPQHSYSRQACAEPLERTANGGFKQAEVTSCGLNGGPLAGIGRYEARIACNLWAKEGTGRYDASSPRRRFAAHPYFTQSGKDRDSNGDQYIANMRDGAVAGFKYFDITDANAIRIEVNGKASGHMEVASDADFTHIAARIKVDSQLEQSICCEEAAFELPAGKTALYFRFVGDGALNFHAFELLRH